MVEKKPLSELETKEVEKVLKDLAKRKIGECPKCKSNKEVVPIAFGKPGRWLLHASILGKVHLAGCMVKSENNYCKTCKTLFKCP